MLVHSFSIKKGRTFFRPALSKYMNMRIRCGLRMTRADKTPLLAEHIKWSAGAWFLFAYNCHLSLFMQFVIYLF